MENNTICNVREERGIITQLKRLESLVVELRNWFEQSQQEEDAINHAVKQDYVNKTVKENSTVVSADKEINELHEYVAYIHNLLEFVVLRSSLQGHILAHTTISRKTVPETIRSVAEQCDCLISELRKHNPHLTSFTDDEALPENTLIKVQNHLQEEEKQEQSEEKNMEMLSVNEINNSKNSVPNAEDTESYNDAINNWEYENILTSSKEPSPLPHQNNKENSVKCIDSYTELKHGDEEEHKETLQNDEHSIDKSIYYMKDNKSVESQSITSESNITHLIHQSNSNSNHEIEKEDDNYEPQEFDHSSLMQSFENSPSACIPRVLTSAALGFSKNITVPELKFTNMETNHDSNKNKRNTSNCIDNNKNIAINMNSCETEIRKGESIHKSFIGTTIDADENAKSNSSSIVSCTNNTNEQEPSEKENEYKQEYEKYLSSSSSESFDDEFDTIAGIAEGNNVTVSELLYYNPFLCKYNVDEPLPENLSIILPIK